MSNLESNPDYVSVDAAAEKLSVSSKTIRNWIRSGQLPAYETGPKLIRINVLDLRAFCKPARQVNWALIGDDRSKLTESARKSLSGQSTDLNDASAKTHLDVKSAKRGQNDLD